MGHNLLRRSGGWLGHVEIPRPSVVRRERPRGNPDWLDCLLAIWIAQAALDSLIQRPSAVEDLS